MAAFNTMTHLHLFKVFFLNLSQVSNGGQRVWRASELAVVDVVTQAAQKLSM